MRADDDAIIEAFITSVRRERCRALLGNPLRRRAMLDRLNHCRDLDDRYARLLPPATDVASLLRARGSPDTCYVLSDTPEIDGRTLPLEAAESGGWGTILSCVAGELGYDYDESGERRMLLERPARGKLF